jgi:menaquinone-dependent protoporphyrinogen oxidase
MRVLMVYGTRYGATGDTIAAIAKMFREAEHMVQVVDAEKDQVETVEGYDLVIVGSGIRMGKWTKGPDQFLQKFRHELQSMKVVLFVSSAMQAIYAHENDLEEMAKATDQYLKDQAKKYGLSPISMAVLGGIFPYDTMGFVMKKTLGQMWRKFEEAGFEKQDGSYDTRDWWMIEVWVQDLMDKVQGIT